MSLNIILKRLTNSEDKTKKILLGCYEDHVLGYFYKEEMIEDISHFLDWLSQNSNFDVEPLRDEIGRINIKLPRQQFEEVLDGVLSQYLGKNNIRYRMKFNVIKILKFMQSFGFCRDCHIPQIIKNVDSMKNTDDIDYLFDKLNDVFFKVFDRDYDYYENVYKNYTNKIVNIKFKKWKSPRFKIIDKYGILKNINNASKIIKKYNKDEYSIGGKIEGDEELERTQLYVQQGMDSTLKNDYTIIGNLLKDDEDIKKTKKVWYQIYLYLKNKKIRPFGIVRKGLILLIVFLVVGVELDVLIKRSIKLDLDVDIELLRNKNSQVYGIITDAMNNIGNLSQYYEKLKNYINPPLNFTKLFKFIEKHSIEQNNIIEKIIQKTKGLSPRQQKEVSYIILKENKDYLDKSITRERVYKLIGN